MQGIDKEFAPSCSPLFRYLLPPCPQRYVATLDQFATYLLEKTLHALFLNALERDSIASRSPIVTLRHLVRSAQRLALADVSVQTPETPVCGSAFALAYIFRLRSCKSLGAFVISPLPPMLPEESLTAGPRRSAGVTPPHRYCRPVRLPLAFGPLSRCPRLYGLPCSNHF